MYTGNGLYQKETHPLCTFNDGPSASKPVVRLNKYATKTRLNKENLWGHKKKKFGYYKDTSNALMQFGRD